MTDSAFARTREYVEAVFGRRRELSAAEIALLRPHLETGIEELDAGRIRAASLDGDCVVTHDWVKKLIVLQLFWGECKARYGFTAPAAFDKLELKFDGWTDGDFGASRLRVVPGAVVRRGAYVAPDVVLMPSFVNIGAHIGEGTMIDTWATIGSCAQIGSHCHISGGVGIGGVLEPLNDAPVFIEDHVFIGARSEIAEGVRVRKGAVIGMGVFLGQSTPIVDRASGEVFYGEVPENAVVIPGSRLAPAHPGVGTYAAVIVKYADDRTRGKTALNADARPRS